VRIEHPFLIGGSRSGEPVRRDAFGRKMLEVYDPDQRIFRLDYDYADPIMLERIRTTTYLQNWFYFNDHEVRFFAPISTSVAELNAIARQLFEKIDPEGTIDDLTPAGFSTPRTAEDMLTLSDIWEECGDTHRAQALRNIAKMQQPKY
jgi:hypothetical protein